MTELFGDFELVQYLTAGGMADLYLARSPRFTEELVIKKIQTRYVDMTRVVKMFIDEGRIAKALAHPNIVKVVDVGQQGGTYFIAMEYIPGRDLLAICRRGIEVGQFLPRHLAVAILEQSLRGLVYAHEKRGLDMAPLKIVHCDISPGNIVVSWKGTAKIVDFGIARATIQLRKEDHSVAGKYNYMAPEQIRGAAVDARADLFALGVILYELTVGKRLFRGRPEKVIHLVMDEPITLPTELRPDFPPSLEAIIMRALERDPDRRYQTARQMRNELRQWLADQGNAHGKLELAIYLRQIFDAQKQHESEEFGGDTSDEDLMLERALPRAEEEAPLEVDPEDPEDPDDPLPTLREMSEVDSGELRVSAAPVAPLADGDVPPLAEPPTIPLQVADTGPLGNAQPGSAERAPAWPVVGLILIGAVLLLTLSLYFLLHI